MSGPPEQVVGPSAGAPPGPAPVRLSAGQREAAAALLSGAGSTDRKAGRRLLEALDSMSVDSSDFWGVLDPETGAPTQACLATPGAGRTAMVFTSRVTSPTDVGAVGAVGALAASIAAACERLAQRTGVRIAQALLEPEDASPLAAFERAGFQNLCELYYLRRQPRAEDARAEAPLPASVRASLAADAGEEELAEALTRSYEDTLDCPELCGMRDARDIVDSHRSTGEYDPDLWWILRTDAGPRGALLLNPCPAQGHVELVYLGLAPELRGRGLAEAVMRMGTSAVARRDPAPIVCAVDERNAPARRLYERLGFVRFSSRLALVRALGAGDAR